ncbi:hypothetical protein Q5P01_000298 [Channa striata]|uniref:Uncharacterized protein n=1 Tax=Channa striata TaxID=64152 RepID=A0AA88IJS5_CHASR|nr:hypothetical protein Q5P01_000298 [Channa striata]
MEGGDHWWGQRDSGVTQVQPADGHGGLRGVVLPESRAQFLQDIVELSSEAAPAAVQGPAQVQRSPDAVATHGEVEQRPLRDCGTSVEVGGELQGLHGEPPPARATCSVATMTDGRSAGPADWGGPDGVDTGDQSQGHSSPKGQRTQRRTQVPTLQVAGNTSRVLGGDMGEGDLLEGDQLLNLDLTPTLTPEVQRPVTFLHAAQVHREGRSLSTELLEEFEDLFSRAPPWP